MPLRRLAATLVVAIGCGGDDSSTGDETTSSGGSATTSSQTSGADTSTSPSTTASTTTAPGESSSSSSSEGGSTFDLGVPPDVGAPGRGCTAVDFLFVVDDSSSMSANQTNLIDNFPTFIAGIESTLGAVDSYHVGVIATDAFSGNPGACILLGALITETTGAGADSSDAVCGPYADGLGYMTEADDLDTTFACAAQVGTMGNGFERPMEAMVTAVGPTLAGVGQCNEGFLRDDALLVVVVITDEWDGPGDPEDTGGAREPPTSAGDPQSWHDDIVAAKGGHEENVAALAITNYAGGPCPPIDTGHDGQNIVDWVMLFGDHGFTGGICVNDYGPFFTDAVDVVSQACADFVPAG
jgi:hypothetical protein